MRWKVFCLILGIAMLINCSEQSIDKNLPTAQNQDGFITEAVRDSNDVPVEIPPRTIIPGQPAYINLTSDDSVITVGGEFTVVHAIVLDEHGWPVGDGYGIRIEITAHPRLGILEESPSFEHVPFDSVTHVVEKTTDLNGQASVALFSGTISGTVRIKATWIDDEDVFDERNLIYIRASLAAFINTAPANIVYLEDETLIMPITSLITDSYTNPVEPLTEVFFELIPDTIGLIESPAYTGGWVDENGDTIGVRGLVHSFVTYSCDHTFDTVRVLVYADTIHDISGPIVLPLYEGEIDIYADPEFLFVQEPGTYENSEVIAQLLDGLNQPVNNGIIYFVVRICGELSGPYVDTTDNNGYANTEFRIWYEQIPHEPPELPNCTAIVVSNLLGYPDIEGTAEIHCTRPE